MITMQPTLPVQYDITCKHCGREFVARKDHWACPRCFYAEPPAVAHGKFYNEQFKSKPGSLKRLTIDELAAEAELAKVDDVEELSPEFEELMTVENLVELEDPYEEEDDE